VCRCWREKLEVGGFRCSIFVVLAVFELFKGLSFGIGIYLGKCTKERKEES